MADLYKYIIKLCTCVTGQKYLLLIHYKITDPVEMFSNTCLLCYPPMPACALCQKWLPKEAREITGMGNTCFIDALANLYLSIHMISNPPNYLVQTSISKFKPLSLNAKLWRSSIWNHLGFNMVSQMFSLFFSLPLFIFIENNQVACI